MIYEGQLTGTDTSQIRALKVVDEFNKKNVLEDQYRSRRSDRTYPQYHHYPL